MTLATPPQLTDCANAPKVKQKVPLYSHILMQQTRCKWISTSTNLRVNWSFSSAHCQKRPVLHRCKRPACIEAAQFLHCNCLQDRKLPPTQAHLFALLAALPVVVGGAVGLLAGARGCSPLRLASASCCLRYSAKGALNRVTYTQGEIGP